MANRSIRSRSMAERTGHYNFAIRLNERLVRSQTAGRQGKMGGYLSRPQTWGAVQGVRPPVRTERRTPGVAFEEGFTPWNDSCRATPRGEHASGGHTCLPRCARRRQAKVLLTVRAAANPGIIYRSQLRASASRGGRAGPPAQERGPRRPMRRHAAMAFHWPSATLRPSLNGLGSAFATFLRTSSE